MSNELEALVSKITAGWRFRVSFFLMMSINLVGLSFNNLAQVFYYVVPEHHCRPPAVDESASVVFIYDVGNDTYVSNYTSSCNPNTFFISNDNAMDTCEGYDYALDEGEWSVVAEWDLVCSWKFLPPLMITLYFLGMNIGGVFFGHLGDRIGRKPVLLFCAYAQVVSGIILYFTPYLWLYIVFRVVLGLVTEPLTGISLILLLEYTPTHLRALYGGTFNLFWCVGALIFAAIAYTFRSWRDTQLVITLPFLTTCVYLWFIPESIRLLLTKSRIEDAQRNAERVCRWNGLIPDGHLNETLRNIAQDLKNIQVSQQTYNYTDLFKTPVLRRRFLIGAYSSFTVAVCYYGILINTVTLHGNKYLNFGIGAALEFVAYVFVIPLLLKIGRKTIFSSLALMGGATCILGVLTGRISNIYDLQSLQTLSTMSILVSKALVNSAFGVIILLMNELFPTVVRSMALGGCVFAMRAGSLLAPQMASVGEYTDASVPFITFGVLLAISGVLVLTLPEPKGTEIPDTIQDIEKVEIDKEMVQL